MAEAIRPQVSARVAAYPLLSALLERRTRRFGAGMTLGGGPLKYSSSRNPVPLTLDEEAALAFAACGITGTALGEMDYTTGEPGAGGGTILASFIGRTAASGDAIQSIAVVVMNDEGTWLLPRPQDLIGQDIPALVEMARAHRLVDVYQRTRVRLANHRVTIPRDMPYNPPFNRWDANLPGTTYFLPVFELSGLYINMLLSSFAEEIGAFIRDDRNGFRPAGIGRFAKSKGGYLHDAPTPLGFVGTVSYLETLLLQFVTVELGGILQNLSLMTEALGLGGFPHAGVHPQWMSALGFDVEHVPFTRTIAAGFLKRTVIKLLGDDLGVPTAVGLKRDGRMLFKPYCPPHFQNMEDAVMAFVQSKYAPGQGIFRGNPADTPWKHGAEIQSGIQKYSDNTIAAAVAYADYVYGRYGRFPCTTGPLVTLLAFQAHHLDPDFYERFYRPGSLSSTQLRHQDAS